MKPAALVPAMVYLLAVCCLSLPAQAAPEASWPVTYIQSGFATGGDADWVYPDYDAKKLRVKAISYWFDASEVLNFDVDTADGFADIRDLSRAMADWSRESGALFQGFWSFPRFPGFFRPEDIDAQPVSFRSASLKADGSLWLRRPPSADDQESKIKFTGEVADISNPEAVECLFSNYGRAMRCGGPPESSVGPLQGYVVFNEATLSGNYESVYSDNPREHDVSRRDAVMRLGHKTHHELMSDRDPYYSFYNPPKRAVPLFTEQAARAFAAYAKERGYAFQRLPADRNEFLDDDTLVNLPPWIALVPLAEEDYWRCWEDWVYATWTGFMERVCRETCQAQAGNDAFRGVIYFQLPSWYSLREGSKSPVTYRYRDEEGEVHAETVTLADDPEYDRLNQVAMGTDMERLIASPWLAGVLHETTMSIHVDREPGATPETHDVHTENHERYRHYYLAQGALLRKVCHGHGKLFGAFARSQYFMGHKPLDPAGFERAFRNTIMVLEPDIIATIGPWFAAPEHIPPECRDVLRGTQGTLEEVWLRSRKEYASAYPGREH